MSLSLYNKKRDFKQTAEPEGKKKNSKPAKLEFVIQRHKATRLHYDLRLQMEGVLKSWAVPKGPSLNPADKRLAMMVEDHPFNYKDFEGEIPKGNYGAGLVEIWDKGTYTYIDENIDDQEKALLKGLKSGNLKFRLNGKKVKGEFALVKLKNNDDNSWLLIKHRDDHAVTTPYDAEEHTPKPSKINKLLAKKQEEKPKVKSKSTSVRGNTGRKLHDFIPAMLAKDKDEPFDSEDWIFEMKWDGYRAIAEVTNSKVKLYSRNGNAFNTIFPVIIDELKKQKLDVVLDGEIVVINEKGEPDFQKLQHYDANRHLPLHYYVFDVLELDGKQLYDLPLIERKEKLKEILPDNPVIKYSDHVEKAGIEFFEIVGQRKLEGIMAKRKSSSYFPGKRTPDWLKIKHHNTDEAIIAGYTAPRGGRKYFGALVLGAYRNGKLQYIGHSGGGFDSTSLKEIYELLQPLVVTKPPFNEKVKTNTPVTWVKPQLVCEVKFTEWTRDGKLRHPIFLRIRDDKEPEEVGDKKPEVTGEEKKKADSKKSNSTKAKAAVKKSATKNSSPGKKAAAKDNGEKEKVFTYGKIEVITTNRNKIFFPGSGITKGDIIDYYDRIADHILPYLKDRPQSLFRTPNGINGKGFFHKNAGEKAPGYVKSVDVVSGSANRTIDYILCNNKATLLYMANLGCIEINPWHSRAKSMDHPDYMIIDIDPSEKNTFNQVIDAALVVKEILDKAGAVSVCKTSGASGLHVYVPLGKKYTYDQAKDFAYLICMMANEQISGFTTLERSLKKRRKDQIYMDYLQNRRGQTIASVYSARPKPGASVSTPLHWDEVKHGLTPQDFNIFNIEDRIQQVGDLFTPVLGKGVDLVKCIERLAS